MQYKDLNLKINTETKKVPGLDIEVLQYLPIQDKIDLIEITLQKAERNGVYNDMRLEMYFNLYLIFLYTDLVFTDEEKADEFTLYNELESNDIISKVIATIPAEEYDNLFDTLCIVKKDNTKYNNSISSVLNSFVKDLPKNAESAMNIMQNFNPNDYKEIQNFAEKANANRPIEQ